MSIERFEIWVHDHILKNDVIRHAAYGAYQRVLYSVSPKFKFDGPLEKVTPDDGYEYLFGYYDKCPWSDDGKNILALKVKNASVEADSTKPAEIVRIELATKKIEKLATTHTWNVQQGCMMQWLSNDEILFNDFRSGKYCAVVLNFRIKKERIIDMPIYAMSSDKKTALSLDFSRLHRLRPGYGYANLLDETKNDRCPNETCIWKIDIASGKITPLLKYTDFASFEPKESMKNAEHKVNHLMISPNGKRFMVLHRWFKKGVKYTRLITCNMNGTGMYNLSDDNYVSHCCWKNDGEILSYLNKKDEGKGYYLLKDKTQNYRRCWEQLAMDGHPTYSYDGKHVVTDTYPDRKRIQSLYIMDDEKVTRIARVFSPFKYGLNTRCDLHPRWSRDGRQICFDASFDGKRSICLVNIEKTLSNHSVGKYVTSNKPKASIIMPCYNSESLLDETMESLEKQTCKDFEVICINDGSTDGTLKKLKEWQKRDAFALKIIDQNNSGVSCARNKGLISAKGEVILFLDADDVYHPIFVEQMLRGVKKADIAYSKLSRNLEDIYNCDTSKVEFEIQNIEDAMRKLLYEMGSYAFCCYAYKKELLKKTKITFDEDTKYGEDREFNWKYISHCKNAAWVNLPLYGYRLNKQSATKKPATWQKTDLLKAVKRIEKYLDEQKCSFSGEFNSYMYARAMWAVAKAFAVSGNKQAFKRLIKEYKVRKCMKRLLSDRNKLVVISSCCYLVNPNFFFSMVRMKK